ncbi:hypothetical protein COO60DRAFT_914761 [Scenedesmus sp. NREL 46B-D3]|nr:hypothetical protein COO60DRAFT_914761 [Scenedesmus sp. NREL 46B-D3]
MKGKVGGGALREKLAEWLPFAKHRCLHTRQQMQHHMATLGPRQPAELPCTICAVPLPKPSGTAVCRSVWSFLIIHHAYTPPTGSLSESNQTHCRAPAQTTHTVFIWLPSRGQTKGVLHHVPCRQADLRQHICTVQPAARCHAPCGDSKHAPSLECSAAARDCPAVAAALQQRLARPKHGHRVTNAAPLGRLASSSVDRTAAMSGATKARPPQ